jgi:hypothetical protein
MQPRSLKIDGREVFVDTTPMELPVARFDVKIKTLHRVGRQILVLKPCLRLWLFRLFALWWLLCGVTLVYVLSTDRGRTGKSEPLGPYWGALFASPFLVPGLLMLVLPNGRVVEFDRNAGCMRTYRLWRRRERPLREVLAIQLIKARSGCGYQLNLVLDDDRQTRFCLSQHSDWKTTHANSLELAEFLLGVALLDEVSGDQTEVV